MRRFTVAVVVGVLVLGASACGSSSTDVAEGAGSGTDASSASPTHAAEAGEPDLIQVEGYEYSSADELTDTQLQGTVEGFSAIYADYSAHVVSQDGEPAGMIVLISLTPEGVDMMEQDPEAMLEGSIKGMMPGIGADTFATETISGEDVWTAEGDAGVAYAWLHADAVSMFVGEDPEVAEAFVTAYLAEANG